MTSDPDQPRPEAGPEAADADGARRGAADRPGDAPLEALRSELEAVDELPVEQRLEVFTRANQVIADELAQLDEV